MLLCVSRNHAECQSGMSGMMPSGGVAIGAVFLRSENALHEVPRKGYVFHGMGPSCSLLSRGGGGGQGGFLVRSLVDGAGSYSVAHRAGLLPTELTGTWGWILLRSPHRGRGSPPAAATTKQRPASKFRPGERLHP